MASTAGNQAAPVYENRCRTLQQAGSRGSRVRQTGSWVVAALLFATGLALPLSVHSADLSSSCCADLEARVDELESTLARRGTPKMSLILSGQVTRSILGYDDGALRNAHVVDGPSGTRFRLEGSSNFGSGFTAGYYLELSSAVNPTSQVDQVLSNPREQPDVNQMLVFMRYARLGALTLGFGQTATSETLGANLGGQGVVATSNVMTTGGNLVTRSAGIPTLAGLNFSNGPDNMSLRWRRLAPDLGSDERPMIRYDSPVLADFVFSTAFASDDFWDFNLRYARIRDGLSMTAQVGFSRDTTETSRNFGWPASGDDDQRSGESNGPTIVNELQASASIWHMNSGLFLSAAYQMRNFRGTDAGMQNSACGSNTDAGLLRAAGVVCANRPDFHYVWLSSGLRKKWWDLGLTSLYGEYATSWDAVSGLSVGVVTARGGDIDFVTDSRLHVVGGGIVQTIDAAAMDLFLSVRHYRADVSGLEANGSPVKADIDPTTIVVTGARIRF